MDVRRAILKGKQIRIWLAVFLVTATLIPSKKDIAIIYIGQALKQNTFLMKEIPEDFKNIYRGFTNQFKPAMEEE